MMFPQRAFVNFYDSRTNFYIIIMLPSAECQIQFENHQKIIQKA